MSFPRSVVGQYTSWNRRSDLDTYQIVPHNLSGHDVQGDALAALLVIIRLQISLLNIALSVFYVIHIMRYRSSVMPHMCLRPIE